MFNTALRSSLTAVAFAMAVSTSAVAGPLPLFPLEPLPAPQHAPRAAAYAPVQSPVEVEEQAPIATQSRFKRQVVNYATNEAPGTVVVDTANTYLYFVLGGGKALRYGIGVGRDGFTWSGVKTVERKAEWPDWRPPQEMLERQPYLPRFMAGGPENPLGARAMYLSGSVYRIHGTNAPSTIGQRVSSGCFRLKNEDVKDLYERVKVGAKVVVLPINDRRISNRSGFSTN
jgi:lipoprotein-anchoring transpeptidase ErfK/SrfK